MRPDELDQHTATGAPLNLGSPQGLPLPGSGE